MTDAAPALPPNPRRYAKGVRGNLPMPTKTSAELEAIRQEVAGMPRRDAIERMRAVHRLSMEQCGQVLGVSESRVTRILKPQDKKGAVYVRCTSCRWRGRRMIDSHDDCPNCGAGHELVVMSSALQWVQVPIPVDALQALGPDYEGTICKAVARIVAKAMEERAPRRRRKKSIDAPTG